MKNAFFNVSFIFWNVFIFQWQNVDMQIKTVLLLDNFSLVLINFVNLSTAFFIQRNVF